MAASETVRVNVRGTDEAILFPGAEVKCDGWQQVSCQGLFALVSVERLWPEYYRRLPDGTVAVLEIDDEFLPLDRSSIQSELDFAGTYKGENLYRFCHSLRMFHWSGTTSLKLILPDGNTRDLRAGDRVVAFDRYFIPVKAETACKIFS